MPGDPKAALRILRDSTEAKADALKQSLAQLLMEYFTTFVNSFVRQSGHEHDGYLFNWDQEPVVDGARDENNSPIVAINFGINILCKEEDFDFFEDLLQDKKFADLYGQAITAIFAHYLQEAGIKVLEENVKFTEAGFGYG